MFKTVLPAYLSTSLQVSSFSPPSQVFSATLLSPELRTPLQDEAEPPFSFEYRDSEIKSPCSPDTAVAVLNISGTQRKKDAAHYECSILTMCNKKQIPGIPTYQITFTEESMIMVSPWYKHQLKDYVTKNPIEIKKLFYQICSTIYELHELHIAHYDIKPENIVVDKSGKPFLIDFGCALKVDSTTGDCLDISYDITQGKTTEIYTPPKEMDLYPKARDVFSLGLTLFECATGKSIWDELKSANPSMTMDSYLAETTDAQIIEIIDKYINDPALNDLLKGMLKINDFLKGKLGQRQRLTMEQVVNHEYFKILREAPDSTIRPAV